ncbi:MAG: AAA family ATPase [Acidimicrobiia bacterium]
MKKPDKTAFTRVVDALRTAGCDPRTDDSQGSALCPAHDDHNPSLSLAAAEESVLINCHAGCTTEAIVEALGLSVADLFDIPEPTVDGLPVAMSEYIYRDETGDPLFRVVRSYPKEFRQHRWNGEGWDSTLGDARRVLYRLPDLIAGIAAGGWVFVVEGEKDAERLIAEGFIATTIAMGANPGNWDRTETAVLDGAYVAVIADNDPQGRGYASHVANSLTNRAAEVRMIQLSGLADGGDVSDWLDNGGTNAVLAEIVNTTRKWVAKQRFEGAEPYATVGGVSVYHADSLREWANQPATWRIRGVLIEGTHLVVGASKKTLKTTLVSGEMAYAIANGTPWLDHEQFAVEAQAPVIVVINEGIKSYMRSLDRIPARRGAESLGPIYVVDASGFKLQNGDLNAVIRETADRVGAGVIIYDAWYGFVGGDADPASLFSMSDVFKIIQDVADELGIDPVIVHHLKKFSKGRPDLDDLTFAGVAEWADSWLLITHRSPARPDEGEFLLGVVAGSRQWGELDYEIDGSLGPIDLDVGGYTDPPTWFVTKVSAEQSRNWGGKSSRSAPNAEPGILKFIGDHPYEYTKSQVADYAPGSQKTNRYLLASLLEEGTVVSAKVKRLEANGIRTRDLLALSGVDPAGTEQQRLAPIGNDLPTYVGQGGAGNSPEAAVSALSEPRLKATSATLPMLET